MHNHHNTLGFSFTEFVAMRSKSERLQMLHGVESCATGTLVGRNLVLTVDHAIQHDESAKIMYKDTVLEAGVLARMPDIDVMLLEFDDSALAEDVPWLDFGFADPLLGQKGYSIGYPLADMVGFIPVFYSFEVTRLKVDKKPFFQFNSEVSGGCSGSIVVNDMMEIMGVVTSKAKSRLRGVETPTDWGFATKSQYFKDTIQKYLSPINMRPKPRLTSEEIARRLSQTAVVVLGCGGN